MGYDSDIKIRRPHNCIGQVIRIIRSLDRRYVITLAYLFYHGVLLFCNLHESIRGVRMFHIDFGSGLFSSYFGQFSLVELAFDVKLGPNFIFLTWYQSQIHPYCWIYNPRNSHRKLFLQWPIIIWFSFFCLFNFYFFQTHCLRDSWICYASQVLWNCKTVWCHRQETFGKGAVNFCCVMDLVRFGWRYFFVLPIP